MTHLCPGGCGVQVERSKFACRVCWARLPKPFRDAINRAYRDRAAKGARPHLAAMKAAIGWYERAGE